MHGTAWAIPDAPRLPPLPNDVHTDVLVVGLGGTGLSLLETLARRGFRHAIGIDGAGLVAGAAGRNGGFLLAGPAHFHHQARSHWGPDLARRFYAHTRTGLDDLVAEHAITVRRTGSVRLAADDSEIADLDAHEQALRDDGFPVERPSRDRLVVPDDAVFDPARRGVKLATRILDAGIPLYAATVLGIEPGGVHTDRGHLRADQVFICVDGALPALLPAPMRPPGLRTVRLQMCATVPEPRRLATQAMYRRFGLDYWQQRPDGRIFLGGCRDLGEPAEHAPAGSPAPACEPTDAVQRGLDHLLRAVVGTQAPVQARWAGLVAYTDDGVPVWARDESTTWVGAYSGTGNIVGSVLGRDLARRAMGQPEGVDDLVSVVQELSTSSPRADGPRSG